MAYNAVAVGLAGGYAHLGNFCSTVWANRSVPVTFADGGHALALSELQWSLSVIENSDP